MSKCWECPHFKIQYEPIKVKGGGCWDFGRAKCNKYDLIVEFPDHRGLKKFQCVMDAQRLVQKEEVATNAPTTDEHP